MSTESKDDSSKAYNKGFRRGVQRAEGRSAQTFRILSVEAQRIVLGLSKIPQDAVNPIIISDITEAVLKMHTAIAEYEAFFKKHSNANNH